MTIERDSHKPSGLKLLVTKLKPHMNLNFSFGLATVSILIVSFLAVNSASTVPLSSVPLLGSASDWTGWAATAWAYYKPGVGVNSNTGLHRATLSWHCFTDWDLGSYIYATIYARKLNLITDTGTWQFNDRVSKVLPFLQNRPLGPNNTPYLAYDWATGQACSDRGTQLTETADSGRLLAALYGLRTFSSGYASAVDNIFARSKSAYDTFATTLQFDYYSYLVAEGYAAFGYSMSTAFSVLDTYPNSASYVTVYGQELPAVKTLSEPIIHTILEADTLIHQPSSKLLDFAGRVYLAQSGRYSATGKLTAYTEGPYAPSPPYVYEWIIYPTKTSQQFVLGDGTLSTTYSVPPIAYTKVAFAYLATYCENSYTSALVNAVKGLATSNGFGEGVFENGSSAVTAWSDKNGFYSDKTNELVLAAASHALTKPCGAPTSATSSTSSGQTTATQTTTSTGQTPEISSTGTSTLNELTLQVSPSSLTINRGASWLFLVNAAAGTPQVTLTVNGLPAGWLASVQQGSGSTQIGAIMVTTSQTSPIGDYSFQIVGITSTGLTDSSSVAVHLVGGDGLHFAVSSNGSYIVELHTNSTVQEFNYNPSDKSISMVTQGPDGTYGMSTFIFPAVLIDGTPIVSVDGSPAQFMYTTNSTHIFLVLSYSQSTRTLGIKGSGIPIPESLSPATLGIAVSGTVLMVRLMIGTRVSKRLKRLRRKT